MNSIWIKLLETAVKALNGIQANRLREYREYKAKAMK